MAETRKGIRDVLTYFSAEAQTPHTAAARLNVPVSADTSERALRASPIGTRRRSKQTEMLQSESAWMEYTSLLLVSVLVNYYLTVGNLNRPAEQPEIGGSQDTFGVLMQMRGRAGSVENLIYNEGDSFNQFWNEYLYNSQELVAKLNQHLDKERALRGNDAFSRNLISDYEHDVQIIEACLRLDNPSAKAVSPRECAEQLGVAEQYLDKFSTNTPDKSSQTSATRRFDVSYREQREWSRFENERNNTRIANKARDMRRRL